MRTPEIINRYGEPWSAWGPGMVGRYGEPLTLEVPTGAQAVVKFYSAFQSVYVSSGNDYGNGLLWPSGGVGWLAELSDASGSSKRELQIAEKSHIPFSLGRDTPTAVVLVPQAHTLRFYFNVIDTSMALANWPDLVASMWLRAILVDASLPAGELLRLLGQVT